ncbi:MAG TPA: AraC family transcriptional regulator [Sphingobacterium sp.]|nr:AraC family transcriptional regulator [Sphingobacterium sp.]
METKAKLEGFEGEIRIVIPPVVIKENLRNERSNSLCITDIGYYPKAKHHYCHRLEGCSEHILLHCINGKGVVVVENDMFYLEANHYMLIPARSPHSYQADSQSPWTIYWMHFAGTQSKGLVDDIFKRVSEGRNILSFDGEIHRIFNRFCRLLSKGYSREILEYIALNLPHFFSAYLYPEIFKEKNEGEGDVVEQAIYFLKANIDSRVGLPEIASSVHLSVSHLSKLFKSRTGYSPVAYLNHLKIQRACYLLQFSNKRISLISYELGFEDQYYFSRLFKEHMGVSPLHYRKNLVLHNY